MDGFWTTMIAVIVGSLSTATATIGVEWYRARLDRTKRDRERFLQTLYELQDALSEAVGTTVEQLFDRPFESSAFDPSLIGVNVAFFKVNAHMIRVNDKLLSEYLDAMIKTLQRVADEPDRDVAWSHYGHALSVDLKPVAFRIEDLMHGGPSIRRPNPPLDWNQVKPTPSPPVRAR